jgi:heme b synthase
VSHPHPMHPGDPAAQGDHALRLVFWETTSDCNLTCRHCRRLDVDAEAARNDLTTDQAKKLIAGIREVGRPILVLSGGEPLMRPDLFELAGSARDAGLPVALATNGTLIDDAMADRIVAAGIRRVAISIDGADAATHDDFRGLPGSLQQALEGFDRLHRRGMSMQINCTVTQHNVHQLDRLYDLALSHGADALHLFMLVPVGCGVQIAETNMLSAGRYEQVLRWLHKRGHEGKLQVKATCAPHFYRILQQEAEKSGGRLQGPREGMAAVTRGCLAGLGVCFVSHTGEVFPCGYLPVSAGNIRAQPLAEIWRNAEVFEQLRDFDALVGKCRVCEFTPVCGGCRARAYHATGNYLDEEPYCSWRPAALRKPS